MSGAARTGAGARRVAGAAARSRSSTTGFRARSPRPAQGISRSFPAAASIRRRSPTSSPTPRTATPASGRRRPRWSSSRPTRSTGCANGWGFRPTRAGCSPPAARWRPSTRSSARRERYLGAEIRRGVLYTSDQAHHSVLKSAKLAGVMPDRVRAIASDDRSGCGRSCSRDAIAADRRAGLTPFAVVSSAGTTNTGAVDPLDDDRRSVRGRGAVAPRRRRLRRVLLSVRRAARRRCGACRAPIR